MQSVKKGGCRGTVGPTVGTSFGVQEEVTFTSVQSTHGLWASLCFSRTHGG